MQPNGKRIIDFRDAASSGVSESLNTKVSHYRYDYPTKDLQSYWMIVFANDTFTPARDQDQS
jgi:hypothetical protein